MFFENVDVPKWTTKYFKTGAPISEWEVANKKGFMDNLI